MPVPLLIRHRPAPTQRNKNTGKSEASKINSALIEKDLSMSQTGDIVGVAEEPMKLAA